MHFITQKYRTPTWIVLMGMVSCLLLLGMQTLFTGWVPVYANEPVLTHVNTLPGQFRALAIRDMAFSSDGRHLYVVGTHRHFGYPSGVALFIRDVETGALRYESALPGAGHKLLEVTSVTLSPDERHLYATSEDEAVQLYARDEASGILTPISGSGAGHGFWDFVFSPDGKHAYASHQYGSMLTAYQRDMATGKLTNLGMNGATGLGGGRDLRFNQAGTHLYHVTEGGVTFFTRNAATGQLSFVETWNNRNSDANGLDEAQSLTLSPDEAFLYVIGNENAIVTFQRDLVTGQLTLVETIREDMLPAGQLVGYKKIVIAPDGKSLYSAVRYRDSISIFHRNGVDGRLTYSETLTNFEEGIDGLRSAYALAYSPDGKDLYVGSHHAFAHFSNRADGTTMRFLRSYPALMWNFFDFVGLRFVFMTPNGRHLYVTTNTDYPRGRYLDSVLAFARDPHSGNLTPTDVYEQGGVGEQVLSFPSGVVATNDDRHLYVSSRRYGLAVFQQNPQTQRLTFVDSYSHDQSTNLGTAADLFLSPDQQHLYVAGGYNDRESRNFVDAIASFKRDPDDGTLVFLERVDVGELNGNGGARSLLMTADGAYLYTISINDNAVVAFARDASSGQLTQIDKVQNGVDGVINIDFPESIVLSNDEKQIYVGSRESSTIVTLQRDQTNGQLHYQESIDSDPVGELAIDPRGVYLYALSWFSKTLTVYEQNGDGGSLTFVERYGHGTGTFTDTMLLLATSPDGNNLYVTTDESLLTFDVRRPAVPQVTDIALAYHLVNTTTVEPGDAVTYTLDLSNQGLYTATNVAITVALPSELDQIAIAQTLAEPPSQQGSIYTWAMPRLAATARHGITITGQLDPSIDTEQILFSQAAISATNDITLTNNVVTTSLHVNVPPVLAMTNTVTATLGMTEPLALGTLHDVRDDGPWQITIDWGDGSNDTHFAMDSPGSLPLQNHQYQNAGEYIVTVTVRDRDGGTQIQQFLITIMQIEEPSPAFERYLPLIQR